MKVPNGFAAILRFYGDPRTSEGTLNHAWVAANIVTMKLPYTMYYQGQKVTHIEIHKKCQADLTSIFTQIWNTARIMVKKSVGFSGKTSAEYDALTAKVLHNIGLDSFDGTFVFRSIRGSSSLSCHAFGIAIDIDALHNALGSTHGRMPGWVVKIFEGMGWLWGGHYHGRKDPMHFQAATGH